MTYRLAGDNVAMDLSYQDEGWVVGPFESEPDCQIHASDSDLILFAMGRIPVDATRMTVLGDGRLATQFKAYFPGP